MWSLILFSIVVGTIAVFLWAGHPVLLALWGATLFIGVLRGADAATR